MFNFFAGRGGGSFESRYRVYPVSFIDKPEAENGDKIFMPPSALDRLASLHIEYPMLFKLENRRNARSTHTGVLEFIAEEGMIYVPYWIMQNLVLEEGDIATISSVTLPKGTFVKLQPHSKDFLDISNPKAVLERTLRSYSCLTKGDTICLSYNNKKYYIDIIESKPQDAVSVIETDCEVDFAPPLDYVEPTRQPVQDMDLDEDEDPGTSGVDAEEPPAQPKFQAFGGQGMRLDGKPTSKSPQPPPSSSPASASTKKPAANGTGNGTVKRKAGKVVFGGGNRLLDKKAAETQPGGPNPPKKAEEPPKPDPVSSFHAFSGKGRSLRD